MVIRNFNHHLGDAQRAVAIQILFGSPIAIAAKAMRKLTWH